MNQVNKDHNPLLVALPSKSKKKSIVQKLQLRRKRVFSGAFVLLFAVFGIAFLAVSRAAVSVSSIKSGPWSAASTWSGGQVPQVGDTVTITGGHDILYDVVSTRVSGLNVNGTLTFDPAKSTTLESDKNVIVRGQLVMVPSGPTINQTLRFVNVNESIFMGGGMDVLASDVGLWVMDNGQIYTKGHNRSGWLNTTAGLAQGATQLTLEKVPTGWRVGDRIAISPTRRPGANAKSQDDLSATFNGFHEATISALSGSIVTFSAATTTPHPIVNNKWTPEVMNLTRNVVIEGTAAGKAHVFMRSTKPQFIRYTTVQNMGPRAFTNSAATGRYGLHFHMAGIGSTGSIVEGTVVTKSNNHAFVPHSSSDITFKDTVSYDTREEPYWWDEEQSTHNTLYDHTIAAKAISMDKGGNHYRMSAYFLPRGDGNEVRNSVAVGAGAEDGGGFFWNNVSDGIWAFNNNIAHNNPAHGVSVWQNTENPHTLTNFALYHNAGNGIDHGAYVNNYLFKDGEIYGNTGDSQVNLHAVSHAIGMHFINVTIDSAQATEYSVTGCGGAIPSAERRPTVFSEGEIKGHTRAGWRMDAGIGCKVEFVNNPIAANEFEFMTAESSPEGIQGSWAKVQTASESYKLTYPTVGTGGTVVSSWGARKVAIPAFSPVGWGQGEGLRVSYYKDQGLTQYAGGHILPYVSKLWSGDPAWYTTPLTGSSARVEGEVQARVTGQHRMIVATDDGHRFWFNDVLVGNRWNDGENTTIHTVNLVAGQKYKIKVESFQNDTITPGSDRTVGSIIVGWEQPGDTADMDTLESTAIPAPQLYAATPFPVMDPIIAAEPTLPPYVTGGTPNPDPPADTTLPTASLTAPANNATVNGMINITANATDNVGVSKVEFLIDNVVVNTDSATPYSYSLDTTQLNNGTHTFSAKAYDAAGNTKTSTSVSIMVANTTTIPSYVPEDINQDGIINLLDFSILAGKYGQTTNLGRADINLDGKVNVLDFSMLASKFGT